jgi:hypothetical protein
MADDDRPDFDLFNLLQGPATMMNGVRGLADNGRKAITGLLDTIASLQRAAAALELLATRVDRLVTDLETPLRLLTPELEKAANRVLRVAEIVEGPIDRLLPGLEQAVGTFERLSVNQLPDNLDALRSQVATVVEVFAELPRKLGSLGGFGAVTQLFPGLERLTSAAARLVPGPSTRPATTAATASTRSSDKQARPVESTVVGVVKAPKAASRKAALEASALEGTRTARKAAPGKTPGRAVTGTSTRATAANGTPRADALRSVGAPPVKRAKAKPAASKTKR